jgi:hypothetical protein
MIRRGWKMCGLDRAFNQAFQTNAMDEHMKKSLFKDEASEAEPDSKENDEEIYTDIPIEAIMEHHAAEVATANQPKVASLKQLARKRYGFNHLVADMCWYELSRKGPKYRRWSFQVQISGLIELGFVRVRDVSVTLQSSRFPRFPIRMLPCRRSSNPLPPPTAEAPCRRLPPK